MSSRIAAAVSLVALGCASARGAAQTAGDAGDLADVEAAVEAGRLEEARAGLEIWWTRGDRATEEERGRARYLRARLSADADSARAEYLGIALEARSSWGARAWIRLAQLDLTVGEAARALEDLARLRADYPGSPEIAASWYWVARAHETSGDLDEACAAFDRAVMEGRAVGDPDLVERAVAASRGCAPDGLRFTLQLGAFSRRPPAEDLAASARAGGFEARIVPEGGLEKVRVGRFSSPETARALERRLREKGFSVAVVASER